MPIGDKAAEARESFSDKPSDEPVKMCGSDSTFDPTYVVSEIPRDIVADAAGVHGYLPKPGTPFAKSPPWPDWTDPEKVAAAQVVRLGYHEDLADKAGWVEDLRAQGLGEEAIGRQIVDERNQARLSKYAPEDLPMLYERNIAEHGNPLGPSYEAVLKKALGDPGEVIASALRSNKGMDLLCGICKIQEPLK